MISGRLFLHGFMVSSLVLACGAPPQKTANGEQDSAADCEDEGAEAALRLDQQEDTGDEDQDVCAKLDTSEPLTKNDSGTNTSVAGEAKQPATPAAAPTTPTASPGGAGNSQSGLAGGLGGLLGSLGGGGGGLGGLFSGLGGGGGLGGLLGSFTGGGGGLSGLLGSLGGLTGSFGGSGSSTGSNGSQTTTPAPSPAPANGAQGAAAVVSYTKDISPYLSRDCVRCHSYLGNYEGAKRTASDSLARMKSGNMPPGGGVSTSDLSKFQAWVSAGSPQ